VKVAKCDLSDPRPPRPAQRAVEALRRHPDRTKNVAKRNRSIYDVSSELRIEIKYSKI
jgi:hypothetical protein